ncbi:MAG: hypothetical protein ACYTHJ_11915 [Planctomycetota bacterium]|jgi:hypothetical protein
MRFKRIKVSMAGLVAFLVGFPLSEKAMAGGAWDIATASLDLGLAIADSAGS